MKIDEIKIIGYRRFQETAINFKHGNFAVLAGANNSGKTSFIQLLDFIFNNNTKKSLTFNDFSIEMKSLLNKKIKELNIDSAYDDERFIAFLDYISNKIKISVRFSLSYKENESIGLFANYLMDLEEEMRDFFFEFSYHFNVEKIKKEFLELETKNENNLRIIIENSAERSYFYTDKDFINRKSIEPNEFKQLFNFEYISADRELDDESLKNKKITTTILSATDPSKISVQWQDEFEQLEKDISKNLADSGIKEKFQETTVDALKDLKDSLDDVSKNEIEAIKAELDFNKNTLLNLIKNSLYINYSHSAGDFLFNLTEESQGLGVSNLIFMSLQISSFSRKITQSGRNTVNFFVVEEPEAHMHIQMQKVLVDYINTIFKNEGNVQGLITTHSTEIVKNVNVHNIKVIRPEKNYMNRLVDLHQFIEKNGEKEFYETFFKLNFADLIFSDAVIFYEGDAERMYFESVITRENTKFKNLSRQYISYCQCGGAHAHKYFPLLEELKIRACVFTDIDYDKERESLDNIDSDKSTNATLNFLLTGEKNVGEIYKLQVPRSARDGMVEVFTQTSKDGHARTLEDALLFKMISKTKQDISVFTEFDSEEWKSFNKELKLFLPAVTKHRELKAERERIYQELGLENSEKTIEYLREKHPDSHEKYKKFGEDCKPKRSVRDIVSVIDKTNFMYSIIMNKKEIELLPNYIEEGLLWLDKQLSIE